MASKQQPRHSVGFWCTLWQLVLLLRPFLALLLVVLSIIEAVLVSKGDQHWLKHFCRTCLEETLRLTCSWPSCWPVLPYHCGPAALTLCENHSPLSCTVYLQYCGQVHQPVAIGTAGLQVRRSCTSSTFQNINCKF